VAFMPVLRAPYAPGTYRQRLFGERFVVLARKGHPRVKARLGLRTYTELPHAFVAPGGTGRGIVDDVLEQRGLSRRVALQLPGFLVAPEVVARSDLIVTLAERVARRFAERLPLRVFAPPVPLPGFELEQVWHERVHVDPAHAWLRGEIALAAKDI